MLEELNKLRDIGAQKIYEDTHISLKYVQSIIHESFEGLTKVQFLGFVSILEREYSVDLSLLRKKGLEYFDEEALNTTIETPVLGRMEPKKNFTFYYVVIVLLIFAAAVYYSFGLTQEKSPDKKIDNSAINSAKKNIEQTLPEEIVTTDENSSLRTEQNTTILEETNQTAVEVNTTKAEIIKPVKISEKVVKKNESLIIRTKKRLWIGYINKTDNIKKQLIIKQYLTLDSSKEWLLSLGHGYVTLEYNAKKISYKQSKNMFFHYKNGELKQLSSKEFKKLNKGRLW